jgi:hypothetical protein
MPYLAVASTSASAVTFMAVPGHEQAKDSVVIAQAYGMTASTALLMGAGRVDWRMKKGSSLPVQSSARRHLMTGEPVCDPFADHLLTPQNCALIIFDYQPVQWPDAGPGPAPLGRAARHPGDHQVDPPGPNRGEPADHRLRVAGGGHAAARRLRPTGGTSNAIETRIKWW